MLARIIKVLNFMGLPIPIPDEDSEKASAKTQNTDVDDQNEQDGEGEAYDEESTETGAPFAATPAQRFALGPSAILYQLNGSRHDQLWDPRDQNVAILRDWWGIGDADELRSMMQWLRDGGHREEYGQEALAWDLGRLAAMARWGAGAKMLSSDEAWAWLLDNARTVQFSFDSWRRFADSYLFGLGAWTSNEGRIQKCEAAVAALLAADQPNAPWAVPWGTSLDLHS